MRSSRDRDGISRLERSAQQRRRRALAHLERVQGRSAAPRGAWRVRRAALSVFAIAVAAGAVTGATGRDAGPTQRVFLHGARHVPIAELAVTAGLGPGAAPLAPAGAALRLELHPWVESARALALPGGTLVLGVVEREPAALWVGDESFVVDAEGVAVTRTSERAFGDLPRLRGGETPRLGEADPELAAAVALARELPEAGLPAPHEVGITPPGDPHGFTLRLPGLTALVVLGRGDRDEKLATLRRLLDASPPELATATRVDLRFRDQAVLDVLPSPEETAQAAPSRGRGAAPERRSAG